MLLTGMGKNAIYDALKVLKDADLLESIQDVNSKNQRFSKRVFRVNTQFIGVFVPASRLEPLPEIGEPVPENREPEAGNRNSGKPNILTTGTNYSTIITTTPENEFYTADTNPSTPPIFPAAPPASPHPVGNLAEWLQSVRADRYVRELFTMGRKVPSKHFDEYFDTFYLEANAKPEIYHKRSDVSDHFLNYAAAKHRIESKPTPQPVNRFNQPEPAPAYKPPKPIAEMPEPKYRQR
jgi:hypothetical protein